MLRSIIVFLALISSAFAQPAPATNPTQAIGYETTAGAAVPVTPATPLPVTRVAPLWSASKGFSVISLAFINPLNGTICPATYTPAALDYLRSTGVDWLRLPFEPASILDQPSGSAAEANYISYVTACADLFIAHGFKVMIDSHAWSLSSSPTWSAANILADYPAGPKWLRYLAMTTTMGTSLAKYNIATVSYQLLNEFPGNYAANLNGMVLAMYQAFRLGHPTMTAILGGDLYSSVDGLATWTLSGFSGNYKVAFTPYIPQQFSHQGVNDGTYYAGYNRLTWPPVGAEQARIAAQINAYPICPIAAPNCYNSVTDRNNAITFLGDYFANPNDGAWIDTQLNIATSFMVRNRLPANRLIITEFGSHGDYMQAGGTTAARATWNAALVSKFAARNWGWGIWHWDDGYFTLGFPRLDPALCASVSLTNC